MAAKRKRPCVVAVQLDPQEKREIQAAAKRAGLALSVYLRALALANIRRADGGVRIEPVA
jgi:hypothetical protein